MILKTALTVANSALIATGEEEGFSTIDLVLIDTNGGMAKFLNQVPRLVSLNVEKESL